ncbi:tRNA (adenosine(37)-N6)-dimethylallyltransferase MiaA [Terricaulis sp.]|uniref:tRNA (adenosine(37)-N6)-dimethylallyltransferase MiaA n=1 Tax=Terricaulis sp. TaxID=2768686 RepID=UPI003783640C
MKPLLIMGPTASGKSALALAVAAEIGGEIVNADSMQVYRDLRVLTARPTPDEEARAPHHLYGHVDAAVRYSVGGWIRDAMFAIGDIQVRRRTPIVVGGTGLYFKALTDGLAEAPEIGEDVRARVGVMGDAELYARLQRDDAVSAARIKPNDRVRLLRAVEVLESGARLSDLHKRTEPALTDWAGLALTPEREPLYACIDARFERMLAAGAIEEARALAARGLDPMLPAMKAHGAPALMAHLRGEISLAEAAEIGKRDTRHYAKRQFTWMAHQMPGWTKFSSVSPSDRLSAALALLDRSR